jgi:uncharacterized repeat protein (TIGR01451 family)
MNKNHAKKYTRLTATLFVAVACLWLSGKASAANVNIYVSPTGDDLNNGQSISTPVKTLTRAQAMERENNHSGNSVTVNVMAGRYTLTDTLVFDYRDSGATWQAYNNGLAEISGGTSITGGWTFSGDVYQTSYSGNLFRQLYVNDARATRARSAESHIVGIFYNQKIGSETYPMAIAVQTADVPAMSNLNTANAPEIHYGLAGHVLNIMRIKSIEYQNDTTSWVVPMAEDAELIQSAMNVGWKNDPGTLQAFFFENARELVDKPGEWYYDASVSMLYYKPRNGETMSSAAVVAPNISMLIYILPNQNNYNNNVTNLTFSGLTFSHTNWLEPSYQGMVVNEGGMIYELPPQPFPLPAANKYYPVSQGFQAPNAEIIPGAVMVRGFETIPISVAQGITFSRNTFKHLGGSGLDIYQSANNIQVIGNVFQDISGDGVNVNSSASGTRTDDIYTPYNIEISNNYFSAIGQDYYGAVGIEAVYPNQLTIRHNEFYNLSTAAIFLDSFTRSTNSMAQSNNVEFNRIDSVCRTRWDTGAIYINNIQGGTGTLIANNAITNIVGNLNEQIKSGSAWLNPGVYLDAGAQNVTVQDNYINNVPLVPPSYVNPGQPTQWGPNNLFLQTLFPPATGNTIGANGSSVTVTGAGLESAYASIRPTLAPVAPSNLIVAAVATGYVTLTWSDNSSNEDGFDVERRSESDDADHNWARVVTLEKNSTSYTDARLQSGALYSYRVKAINAGGGSAYSSVVSITAPSKSFFDTTTSGNWKGKYGSQGYDIIYDASGPSSNYPPYAQVSRIAGNIAAPWASPANTDTHALQQTVGSGRTLGTYWVGDLNNDIVLDVNLTDGLTHQVTLYSVDFYNQNRNETITLKDAATGQILDSRIIPAGPAFVNGVYTGFNVSGHVQFVVSSSKDGETKDYEIVNGIFFDAANMQLNDNDRDGIINSADNCPDVANPDQRDSNGNGKGDLCDPVDVSVTLSGPSSVPIGGTALYVATIANVGPTPASAVTFTDVLPAGLLPTYFYSPITTCSNSNNTVTCNIASLAKGASTTVTIQATVQNTATVGAILTNTATVKSAELDSNVTNNTAKVDSVVTLPSCTGTSGYSIAGDVRKSQYGNRIAATVKLSKSDCASTVTTTSTAGYKFSNLKNGTYTVVPSKSDCVFTPLSRSIIVNGGDVTSNWKNTGFAWSGTNCK